MNLSIDCGYNPTARSMSHLPPVYLIGKGQGFMDFTINFANINLLIIFGATLASNFLGGLWYSPFLFGKPWAAANNIKLGESGMGSAPVTFVLAFVFQMFIASMIAALLGNASTVDGMEGAQLGSLMATCFVLPAMGVTNLFEQRSFTLIAINVSYHVASFTLMGYIIGSMV